MRTWLGHWLTDLSRGRFIMKLTKFKLSSPSLAWASSKVVSSLFCGYQFAFFKEEPKSCISFRPHKIPKGPWSRAEVVPYGWVPLVVLQNSFTAPPFLSMIQPPTPTPCFSWVWLPTQKQYFPVIWEDKEGHVSRILSGEYEHKECEECQGYPLSFFSFPLFGWLEYRHS